MNPPNIPSRVRISFLAALFLLGFLEFSAAAVLVLQIAPDPKSAVLFGYSLSRLAVFLLALLPALGFLALAARETYRLRVMRRLEALFQRAPLFWELAAFALAFLVLLVLVAPVELLGRFGLYFERARPLLLVLCLFPAQFSLHWWIQAPRTGDWSFLRPALAALTALLALTGLMLVSGLGLTPAGGHWNVAGIPLTAFQLLLILLAGGLTFGLVGGLRPQGFTRQARFLDWGIALALFVFAVLFWMDTPIPHNEFASRPLAPYFQSFPTSDARIHDMGALSALKGFGLLFRTYTDKPLYMVFLALLHLFAGYDYNLLAFLHLSFMAGMVPALYVLGKAFHSRLFGFLLAGIILIRQQNAISLSRVLNFNAYPAQFLTETPTLLALILATVALFFWMKAARNRSWRAFIAGSVMGAASLIRLNPFLLIPALPVFLFFSLRAAKKEWLLQTAAFLLGCAVLIVPWMLTGANQSGQSFFILKFQDIISVRYGPGWEMPFVSPPALALAGPNQVSAPAGTSAPQTAGLSLPPLDIYTFPGFVINHTLHNFVGSALTLPDSLQPADQNLATLMERPYWKLGVEWLEPVQVPFVFFNLCLLALGLGWSWRRWRWSGLAPLFVFVVYALSLGLGRTSGSRHIVPLDWLVDFYFALGLLCLFQLLPKPFRQALSAEPGDEPPAAPKPAWVLRGSLILVVCLAALIPAAQTLIPAQKDLCSPVNVSGLPALDPKLDLLYGEVLYPELQKDHLTFDLLTCQRTVFFDLTGFSGKLAVGQPVIAGLDESGAKFLFLPPGPENSAQILWQRETK
jgi:hypothetical protein